MGEDGFRVTWSSQEGWFSALQYWSMFTQLHVSQYHPVKDSDRNRPQYSVWCLARIRIKDVGNQKPDPEFQTWLALAMAQRMLPKYSRLSSHHHRLLKRLKDTTASRVSFQCCYCEGQAGRQADGLWVLFSDHRHHPSSREKDRSCASAMQCQMREWYRDLRWVLRASTKVEQRQQRQWQQQRTSYTQNTGTQRAVRLEHNCVADFNGSGQWLKVKPQIR